MPNKAIPYELKKTIGDRISVLLERDEVSQYRLAHDLGLTESAISKVRKATNAPALETLIEIADYFNVSTDYLLGRTDDEKGIGVKADISEEE